MHRRRRHPAEEMGREFSFLPSAANAAAFSAPVVRVRGTDERTDGSEGSRRLLQGCDLPSQVGVSEEFARINDRSFAFPQYPVSPTMNRSSGQRLVI